MFKFQEQYPTHSITSLMRYSSCHKSKHVFSFYFKDNDRDELSGFNTSTGFE